MSGSDLSTNCVVGGSTQSTDSTKLDSGSISGGCALEAKEEVDIQNAQQRSYTRSSAKDDDKDVRDGKGANTKGRRGRVLSAPDG